MPCDIVVGAQWGDEGKAKVIDYLSQDARYIVRFQGGANAGHTVIHQGEKYVFHLVPSGILHEEKICLIGAGVVVDPFELFREIDALEARGIKTAGRILVAGSAHLILPYHKILDACSETQLGRKKIGTTGKGIGPAYTHKAARKGIRCYDIINDEFEAVIRAHVREINCLLGQLYCNEPLPAYAEFYQGNEVDADKVLQACYSIRERLTPMVCDISLVVRDAVRSGEKVLAEGAQGTGLDISFGTYPFVTSSNPIAGGACVGIGIGPRQIRNVYGILKAYTTRVGAGPFPTELTDPIGEKLRELGGEYGATTGRPRRCGWFDGVFARYATWINGFSHLMITKLDVLDHFPVVKFCTGYHLEGKEISDFSVDVRLLEKITPVYKKFPGWEEPTAGVSEYKKLPKNARNYLDFIESFLDVPIMMVSVGPSREETILKQA